VPVRKEKAVLETEPITEGNVGSATSGPDISEEEHEVVLREERATVDKTVEPVERVRLGTETTTDEKTVTDRGPQGARRGGRRRRPPLTHSLHLAHLATARALRVRAVRVRGGQLAWMLRLARPSTGRRRGGGRPYPHPGSSTVTSRPMRRRRSHELDDATAPDQGHEQR
jgi:hypothetical protein